MANLPQQNTINQYLADGSEVNFTYSYLILLNTDIQVYVTPAGQAADPIADIQELGVDYMVSGLGVTTGGTVTFFIPPANGDVITLSRNILVSIDTNFSLAQNFNGANLDAAFERVTLFTQQTSTILQQRALQYEINTYLPNEASNLVPLLANGQVWSGLNGAVVATTIETGADTSLLRSQLASQAPLGEGALLVGYYDTIQEAPTTVGEYLDYQKVYAQDTGITDAMILTILNSNFKYVNGQTITVIPSNTNVTTTPTLNVNGLGDVVIKRSPTASCQAGDITAGAVVGLIYDSGANEFYITNIFIPTISSINPTVQILSGSGTYTPPPGTTYIELEGVGGGGGGAGVGTSSPGLGSAAPGGGSGGYFRKTITSLSPSYSYSVGAGGAGGSAGVNNGVSGGNTTFGSLTANGGVGGVSVAGTTQTGFSNGPLGGTATGGDINIQGESGGSGYWAAAVSVGGCSGSSQLGSKSAQVGCKSTSSVAGNNGLNYGCGGGGAACSGAASTRAGGNGSNGIIIINEYYT